MSIIAMMLLTGSRMAAQTHTPVTTLQRPKLVVGIVVDQMRWDYLYRYQKHYTEGGFRRMLSEGYTCENTALPYVPSVTAIGHTCIYTGSVPSIHGIAGNNFVKDGQKVYCTDDKTVKPVGSTSDAGLMSPRNLWTTTIGDEMRIASNGRAKVVGVSLKDRASILPAGHNPNGAYWFDDATGRFITSTYYMDKLPQWVRAFNDKHLPERYLSADWNTLYPKATYAESTADDTPYENGIREGVKPMLPLPLPALYRKYGYGIIRNTPLRQHPDTRPCTCSHRGRTAGQRRRDRSPGHQLLMHRLHRPSDRHPRHRDRRHLSQTRPGTCRLPRLPRPESRQGQLSRVPNSRSRRHEQRPFPARPPHPCRQLGFQGCSP